MDRRAFFRMFPGAAVTIAAGAAASVVDGIITVSKGGGLTISNCTINSRDGSPGIVIRQV